MNQVAIRTEAPVAPVFIRGNVTRLVPIVSPRADDSLHTLTERFLSAQDIREGSKQTYRKGLQRFFAWITEERRVDLKREDVLAFKGYLDAQGLSSSTLSTYLVVVRRFFEWAEQETGGFIKNIAKGVKGPKTSNNFKRDALTVDQARELLGAVDRTTLQGKRDHALLNLLIRTGLRTIEVIRAQVEDMREMGGNPVLWIQGKGRDAKDDFVKLTPDTVRALNEYLQARGRVEDKDPLFASLSDRNRNQKFTTRTIRGVVKGYLRQIGLDSKRLSAHSLRHTAVTLFLDDRNGNTIQQAKIFARHADINTTLIYAHNIDRMTQAPELKIDALLAGVN